LGVIELLDRSFEFYGFALFGIILARYLIFAGGTHLFLERILAHTPKTAPDWDSIAHDIKLSVLSSIVFALSAASILSASDAGLTRLYFDIDRYPVWYLGVSYVMAIVLQDTYFYFLHRLFHHRLLFRWWHRGHHLSRPPTPWTSFAFDPLESIAQSLFLVGIVFVLPLHFITIVAILSTMTIWAVVNHLGIDKLPANFPHHWCSRWFTGPAHHAIHHGQYALHYGLYFTFWDIYLGTQSPEFARDVDRG
jgi:Delta7-sterol 5-desaturase